MHLESGLKASVGQISVTGLKHQNEDSIGVCIPREPILTVKGMVAIVADGVSSAEAGKEASETCVRNFITDFFSTPDSWTVKNAAQKVLTALNRWLYGQGVGYLHAEHGYISTMSTLVIKSRTAHIFHIGDSRVYRLRENNFEQLTHDHSARVSKDSTYLTRAMGMDVMLDVDYYSQDVEHGDVFFLSTDGIHDFINDKNLKAKISQAKQCSEEELRKLCSELVDMALTNGSDDNLSCQVVRVDDLPNPNAEDAYVKLSDLPFPPPLSSGMSIDGYHVIEELHASNRSQVYLVKDHATEKLCVMKTPSINYEDDIAYKERFVLEPWIGGRINSEYVVKIHDSGRQQKFLYYVCDYVAGSSLSKWIKDNPKPSIEKVMAITHQIVKGVRAMHRRETFHQDIKPDNIMIDDQGKVTIIDFGSCYIAGVAEIAPPFERDIILGTDTYGAPEYKLGRKSTLKSDLFSIAAVLYEMLTREHPYGERFESSQSTNDFYRLEYRPAREFNPMVPDWMDGAIEKALQISPELRYDALSEFIYDLEHPNLAFIDKSHVPLAKRNPLKFWQGVAASLVIVELVTLWLWLG